MATSGSSSMQPALSAEEIGNRFLKLLEGLTSREDLSLERVQDVTGLTLEPSSKANFFGRLQPMEGGGSYIITFVPETSSIKRGVGLDFIAADATDSNLDATCALAFASYRLALTGMGFAELPIYGEIGQIHEWRYYRGDITLSLNVQDAATDAGTRACVTSVGTLN